MNKGIAFVDSWGNLLSLDADTDIENIEDMRQNFVSETGLVVEVFEIKCGNELWLDVQSLIEQEKTETAWQEILEHGEIT